MFSRAGPGSGNGGAERGATGHTASQGHSWHLHSNLWISGAHMLAQEGRQRPAGGKQGWQGRPARERPGSELRACELTAGPPSVPLPPLLVGAASSELSWSLPGSGFAIPRQALGSLWEPNRAVSTVSPSQRGRGKEHTPGSPRPTFTSCRCHAPGKATPLSELCAFGFSL